jgi:hypothetical protein
MSTAGRSAEARRGSLTSHSGPLLSLGDGQAFHQTAVDIVATYPKVLGAEHLVDPIHS